MKIDVIMPTYNRRRFLPDAIGCLRSQTFSDWRLIVVNDGGEDVSDIVAGVGDSRIAYFDRPHLGKAAQLNFALGLVTAPYVAYMDDDDEIFPEHLEKLLTAAERLSADLVYSDTYLTFLDGDGKVRRRTVENTEDAPYESIRIFNRINHKQVLHTKELVDRAGGYDANMRVLIDYDGIKRLMGAARRPFHLREVTGDHFLREDPATGAYSSISGLWDRDPAAAGRSLLSFFEKDPAALAMLYRRSAETEERLAYQLRKNDRRLAARWKRLLHGCDHSHPGVFRDALPTEGGWREATPDGGIREFFRLADETAPEIAAVNRIAAGDRTDATRAAAYSRGTLPLSVPEPRFQVSPVADGLRFAHPAGMPHRWVMLSSAHPLADDFAIEFDYLAHTAFREQLQFDFRMSSLGDRLRFMVRDNAVLGVNAVENGRFLPDGRRYPLAFPLGRASHVRIESRGGVHAMWVDGRSVASLTYEGLAGQKGRQAAFVFYESDPSKSIDFEISGFKYLVAT